MNFSPLMDAAATLASAIFAASAPIVVLKLDSMLKLNLDQTHRTAVAAALDNALGLGLQLAQEAGDAHLSNVNIRSAALAAMVGYVKQTVPAAVSHFGPGVGRWRPRAPSPAQQAKCWRSPRVAPAVPPE